MLNADCPCGSHRPYERCCGPYIEAGVQPVTAEALMRSRYTAYATMQARYLLETWHPTTRPQQLELDESVQWLGLEVKQCSKGQAQDQEGSVSFIAHFRTGDNQQQLVEDSRFCRENGRWLYVGRNFKTRRNDPCPCGSGKKYKKCCMD